MPYIAGSDAPNIARALQPYSPYPQTGRVVFADDFERNKIYPWNFFDGAQGQIYLDSQVAFSGSKCLALSWEFSTTNPQDASITIPVGSGIVGVSCWFTWAPFTAPGVDPNILLALEKRKAAADSQLQELWFQYMMASGIARVQDSSGFTNLKTFSPVLGGLPTNSTWLDPGTGATDRSNPWHYFLAVADVKNGSFKRFVIDDSDMSASLPSGSGRWFEPGGHTFASNLNTYRVEWHLFATTPVAMVLFIDDVVVTDEG